MENHEQQREEVVEEVGTLRRTSFTFGAERQ